MKSDRTTTRSAYWRKTLGLTAGLLLLWLAVTFGPTYYARELDRLVFFGFPLGFYMAAQGALLVYLLIVGLYALVMDRIEARCGVDRDDD